MKLNSKSALAGKTALITGSTSGIGLGIAKVLAAENVQVILHGLATSDTLASIKNDFQQKYQQNITIYTTDVSDKNAIAKMCSDIHEKKSSVDILINNAGIQKISSAVELADEDWQKIIAINLSAAFFFSKYLLPRMAQNQWGRIINIASAHGLVASANKVAYVAAKHGIVGMTKTLALEHALDNITVNAICPGFVNTPLMEQQVLAISKEENISYEQAKVKLIASKHPNQQLVAIEDVAQLALFLCGKHANNITGSSYPIDGGWLAV